MNEETRIARNEIARVGRATWELGLNSLKSGNISVLLPKNDILISKTGRSLKELNPDADLTVVKGFDTDHGEASSEFYVHRAVYRSAHDGRRGAILHCHPPNVIAATWIWDDEIPPSYNEANDVLGQTSVVESRDREKMAEDPELIAQPLSQKNRSVARSRYFRSRGDIGGVPLSDAPPGNFVSGAVPEGSCR